MHFLPDVYVPCEQCHGKRYNRETLEVRFKGKTIADVLDMPVEEALDFFAHIPKIKRRLQALHDVGLDYIRLGQPATTLSGGEAQRVKLAAELCKVATGATLYILDEPTTGLHFADIQRLLEVLQRLVASGQHRRGDRAQPRRDQDRGPPDRHGPRGRRGGRPRRGQGHAGAGRGDRGLAHRPVPARAGRAGRAAAPARAGEAAAQDPNGGMSGSVEHIHLVAERSGPPEPVDEVVADAGLGLRGDRHYARSHANDLTLIEAEALGRLAAEHDVALAPGGSRRNVTTRGIDLGALIGRRFRVGAIVCEGIERSEPCLHLTQVTGEPGVLRGLVHTGLEAAVIEGGTIRVGDPVEPVE